ncbi:MAG: transporter [Prevotella sp.]|nr:transporter [Prevotella sp.]
MKTKKILTGFLLAAATTAQAGGILTNTNQSIDFLRNPARDAAIGLDGVYSNPAGVAFLPEGFHLGLNWQYAHQTRTITSTDKFFALGAKNNDSNTKVFEGVADAPIIPSIQAAWNKGDWSMQLNFSVTGGGGKCSYENGLGSFERVVGKIADSFMNMDKLATALNAYSPTFYAMAGLPAPTSTISMNNTRGYDMNSFMEGRQYYFGLQLGTAYKVNENLSVYGGLRLLYGDATYRARISNINVYQADGSFVDFASKLREVSVQSQELGQRASEVLPILNNIPEAAMTPEMQQLKAGLMQLSSEESKRSMAALPQYSHGVNLMSNQTGLGVAPIVGIDYRLNDQWNFAAKYEFKTQMRMKNESTLFEAGEIEAVNKYRDGEKVNEDTPALLTLGVQYSPISVVRLNAGAHYYFDKQAEWYGNAQDKLDHNSYELLAGAEWDINDRVTISLGGQITRYGNTDEYINDMSFVVNSYSIGFGMNYKLSDVVKLKAGFFQTEYGHYDRNDYPEAGVSDSFTRTNRVLGIGCDINL